jgi:signal peptidase I
MRPPPGTIGAKLYTVARVGIIAAIVGCVAYMYLTYETWRAPSWCDSMTPTISPGQSVMIHGGYTRARELRHSDVVVYSARLGEQVTRLVGRVFACPGDEVRTKEGKVCVVREGKELASDPTAGADSSAAVSVGERTLYLLNDNRASRLPDSRVFGPVGEEAIEGKVIVIF